MIGLTIVTYKHTIIDTYIMIGLTIVTYKHRYIDTFILLALTIVIVSLCRIIPLVTLVEQPQLKIIKFQLNKEVFVIHCLSAKDLNGTVVNLT